MSIIHEVPDRWKSVDIPPAVKEAARLNDELFFQYIADDDETRHGPESMRTVLERIRRRLVLQANQGGQP